MSTDRTELPVRATPAARARAAHVRPGHVRLAAAARGAGSPRRRRGAAAWQVGTVVVCLVGGALFGTAHAFSTDRSVGTRSVDLSALVRDAERRAATLDAVAVALQAEVDRSAAQDRSPLVALERAAAAELEPAAGATPLTGPGLTVVLADAPRDADGNYPAGVDPDDLVVHQQDVQAVVNAMWAGGAEAMTIMDQRVLTTSAVRCIGNTLLLQGRTYSPPFVVTAIGDADAMTAALDAQPGVQLFRRYVERYGLVYEVTALESVDVPAYDGPIRLTSAREVR